MMGVLDDFSIEETQPQKASVLDDFSPDTPAPATRPKPAKQFKKKAAPSLLDPKSVAKAEKWLGNFMGSQKKRNFAADESTKEVLKSDVDDLRERIAKAESGENPAPPEVIRRWEKQLIKKESALKDVSQRASQRPAPDGIEKITEIPWAYARGLARTISDSPRGVWKEKPNNLDPYRGTWAEQLNPFALEQTQTILGPHGELPPTGIEAVKDFGRRLENNIGRGLAFQVADVPAFDPLEEQNRMADWMGSQFEDPKWAAPMSSAGGLGETLLEFAGDPLTWLQGPIEKAATNAFPILGRSIGSFGQSAQLAERLAQEARLANELAEGAAREGIRPVIPPEPPIITPRQQIEKALANELNAVKQTNAMTGKRASIEEALAQDLANVERSFAPDYMPPIPESGPSYVPQTEKIVKGIDDLIAQFDAMKKGRDDSIEQFLNEIMPPKPREIEPPLKQSLPPSRVDRLTAERDALKKQYIDKLTAQRDDLKTQLAAREIQPPVETAPVTETPKKQFARRVQVADEMTDAVRVQRPQEAPMVEKYKPTVMIRGKEKVVSNSAIEESALRDEGFDTYVPLKRGKKSLPPSGKNLLKRDAVAPQSEEPITQPTSQGVDITDVTGKKLHFKDNEPMSIQDVGNGQVKIEDGEAGLFNKADVPRIIAETPNNPLKELPPEQLGKAELKPTTKAGADVAPEVEPEAFNLDNYRKQDPSLFKKHPELYSRLNEANFAGNDLKKAIIERQKMMDEWEAGGKDVNSVILKDIDKKEKEISQLTPNINKKLYRGFGEEEFQSLAQNGKMVHGGDKYYLNKNNETPGVRFTEDKISAGFYANRTEGNGYIVEISQKPGWIPDRTQFLNTAEKDIVYPEIDINDIEAIYKTRPAKNSIGFEVTEKIDPKTLRGDISSNVAKEGKGDVGAAAKTPDVPRNDKVIADKYDEKMSMAEKIDGEWIIPDFVKNAKKIRDEKLDALEEMGVQADRNFEKQNLGNMKGDDYLKNRKANRQKIFDNEFIEEKKIWDEYETSILNWWNTKNKVVAEGDVGAAAKTPDVSPAKPGLVKKAVEAKKPLGKKAVTPEEGKAKLDYERQTPRKGTPDPPAEVPPTPAKGLKRKPMGKMRGQGGFVDLGAEIKTPEEIWQTVKEKPEEWGQSVASSIRNTFDGISESETMRWVRRHLGKGNAPKEFQDLLDQHTDVMNAATESFAENIVDDMMLRTSSRKMGDIERVIRRGALIDFEKTLPMAQKKRIAEIETMDKGLRPDLSKNPDQWETIKDFDDYLRRTGLTNATAEEKDLAQTAYNASKRFNNQILRAYKEGMPGLEKEEIAALWWKYRPRKYAAIELRGAKTKTLKTIVNNPVEFEPGTVKWAKIYLESQKVEAAQAKFSKRLADMTKDASKVRTSPAPGFVKVPEEWHSYGSLKGKWVEKKFMEKLRPVIREIKTAQKYLKSRDRMIIFPGKGGGQSARKLDLGSFTERLKLPESVREGMGEMHGAGFPEMSSYAKGERDVQLQSLYNKMLDNPDWILPDKEATEFVGRSDVSIPWNGRKYEKLSNDDKWGALAGKYVERGVKEEIVDFMDKTDNIIDIIADKAHSYFKPFKTAWNTGVHKANVLSNFYFANIGGVPVAEIPNRFASAAKSLVMKDNDYLEARAMGALKGNYWKRATQDIYERYLTLNAEKGAEKAKKVAGRMFDAPSRIYDMEDQVAKLAVYKQQKEMFLKQGMSQKEAARKAADETLKIIPQYHRLPKFVNILDKTLFPFFAFPVRAVGPIAKAATNFKDISSALRFWKYPLISGAMVGWLVQSGALKPEEVAASRRRYDRYMGIDRFAKNPKQAGTAYLLGDIVTSKKMYLPNSEGKVQSIETGRVNPLGSYFTKDDSGMPEMLTGSNPYYEAYQGVMKGEDKFGRPTRIGEEIADDPKGTLQYLGEALGPAPIGQAASYKRLTKPAGKSTPPMSEKKAALQAFLGDRYDEVGNREETDKNIRIAKGKMAKLKGQLNAAVRQGDEDAHKRAQAAIDKLAERTKNTLGHDLLSKGMKRRRGTRRLRRIRRING